MKTAEERVEWIVANLAYVGNPVDILNRNFKAFETQIRQDQKEKCAKNLVSYANKNSGGLEFSDDEELTEIIMEAD